MELTDEDIKKFQQLWREEFGEEISADYARKRETELLRLYVLLLGGPPDAV
jgi:hypothetical protein